ncbi:uncharacterized protein LOC119096017 [Pollicipes pollicipes]|uniref:uncharacterized protein LOC119096017 n=1 Tax=Pollicipes pollicipes TaxID=41117 RepID=UPI00188505A7|nr:uncharacterized protein LOC119096017 [Pollicipes pollicipes]
MKLASLMAAMLVAVAAQEHSTHPPNPNEKCHCSFGVHNILVHALLYVFHPMYDAECTDSAEGLCLEECTVHRDVMEAAGGWSAMGPEHHHHGNMSVGDVACQNLGRDESRGIFAQLYHSICDQPTKWSGPGLKEPLCCDKGKFVRCF